MRGRFWLLTLAVALSGCGYIYDEPVSGPYRLVAVDIPEQMRVCYTLEGGDCVGRIPETVFEVGFDDRYIVASSRSPSNDVTYFYIIRAGDGPHVDPSVSVRGPFDATAFAGERSRLGLPELKPIS